MTCLLRNALVLTALLAWMPAHAHDYRVAELEIDHPWARPTGRTVRVGAAYMTIVNNGAAADTLRGATTPRAEHVEIHRTVTENDVSRMLPLPDGIAIPAGGTVEIQPGGYHLMLVGVTEPLRADEKVPLTLDFAGAGSVEVELDVQMRPPAGDDSEHAGH